jgi:outer membrane immunogenic protein
MDHSSLKELEAIMRYYFVGAALALAATPVMAADYLYTNPPPIYGYSEGSDWSGQYIGVTVGGLRPRIDIPGAATFEDNALMGGVFAGVNFQDGNGLVYGAEADADYAHFDRSGACTSPAGWTCRGFTDFQGSLRARLGFATDTFHVYATAGLAVAHVGGSTNDGATEYSDSQIYAGWTAGVGGEVAFSDQWFARAEYRYTHLGANDLTFDTVYPGVNATSHALRAGVGYRF